MQQLYVSANMRATVQVTAAGGCRQVVETSRMRDAMTIEPSSYSLQIGQTLALCEFIHVNLVKEVINLDYLMERATLPSSVLYIYTVKCVCGYSKTSRVYVLLMCT